MKRIAWLAALALPILVTPADAEIIKGVMGVKGAEMTWWGGMARDAIARQYDVDKNRVILTCDEGKGSYRPGTITFHAKPGKSIDLDQIRESIAATRLSGKTNMGMEYLEITVIGTVERQGNERVLKVAGTNQVFGLSESPTNALQKLSDAVAKGEKVTTVIGRVSGWSGRFPVALENLAKTPPDTRAMLSVTDFEVAKK